MSEKGRFDRGEGRCVPGLTLRERHGWRRWLVGDRTLVTGNSRRKPGIGFRGGVVLFTTETGSVLELVEAARGGYIDASCVAAVGKGGWQR